MFTVELHCHTVFSPDSLLTPETLLEACRRKGIDRIAITDHNTIQGALYAQKLDPERVFVGEEIMTRKGELLAFFLQEEVPSGLAPREAIDRLRSQGAVISVSHPFDRFREGAWDLADLLEIAPLVDAIETFNARCMFPSFNRDAVAFSRQHNLPGTAGSDAHTAIELGTAVLRMPAFDGPERFKAALLESEPRTRLSPFWVHFYSTYAKRVKKARRGKERG